MYEDDAGCVLVVGLGDCLEALLTGGIPQLEFEAAPVDLKGFVFEVDADCCEVARSVFALGETNQDVGFADGRITKDYDFADEVVF